MNTVCNPYRLSNLNIINRANYVGRDMEFELLAQNVKNGINTVILGPEGIGKTQFLNVAFNKKARRDLARRHRILVSKFDTVISGDSNEFFQSITDGILKSAEVLLDLEDEDAEEDYARIKRKIDREFASQSTGQSRLSAVCKIIMDEEYHVFLVLDRFEQFVNSRHITDVHHDLLRSLLATTTLRMVVATDYDFNRSTLPRAAAGSLLLQLFSGHEITIPGLSVEESTDFLSRLSGTADFSEEELKKLIQLSGGIPVLLAQCAFLAYDLKQDSGAIDWNLVREQAQHDSRELLSRWVQYLSKKQVDFLKSRTPKGMLAPVHVEELDDCLAPLINRGLVKDDFHDKNRIFPIRSVLLRDYCRNHELPVYQEEQKATGGNTYIVDKYFESGATDQSTVNHTDINNTGTLVVNKGITMSELVHLITGSAGSGLPTSSFQQYLGDQLSNRFQGFLEETPLPASAGCSEEEYTMACDEHFSSVGSKMLPDIQVNEDNEAVIDIEPEELLTIDKRFADIRKRRSALTDELLASQSERCQLYLKLSVIVEDALAFVGAFAEDYSPQLVLYGKALEQALRDNLYPYFSTDQILKCWDTFKKEENPTSSKVFQNIPCEVSFMGSYCFLIKDKQDYLSDQCVANDISVDGKTHTFYEWKTWWRELLQSTNSAKAVRNKADHANSQPPTKEDLNTMCDCLFGCASDSGILPRLSIGPELLLHIRAQENAVRVHDLENTECEVVISRVKEQKSLDCKTLDGSFVVKVSKSAVNRFVHSENGPDLAEGDHLKVLLGLYETQDGNQFFHATIVSRIS